MWLPTSLLLKRGDFVQEDPDGKLGEEERDIMAKYGSGTDDVQ